MLFKKVFLYLILYGNICFPLFADEGGKSFWFPGQFASFAAVPASPGWKIGNALWFFDGQSTGSKQLSRGGTLNADFKSDSPFLFIQPTFVPNTKWLGGQPSFYIGEAYGFAEASAGVSYDNNGSTISRNKYENKWGFSDLYPFADIAWNSGNNNWMVYLMGGIPIVEFDPRRMVNIGTGHAAADLGFGYTYLNNTSGWEFSALLGFTYNWENPSTDYKNGIDSHLDYAFSKFLSEKFNLGIVGYVYNQLTGDSGSGNHVGENLSKAAALGAEFNYFFKAGKTDMIAMLRGYQDFWSENRMPGLTLFAILYIQFPEK